MADIGIFYATSSGRTGRVAEQLQAELQPGTVHLCDLRTTPIEDLANYSVLVLGSPTYGTGDWHPLWQKSAKRIAECGIEISAAHVAVFALGDAKHHRETFAGAMCHLTKFVKTLNLNLIGRTVCDDTYDADACRHVLEDNQFSGLVIDHVKQRRLTSQRVSAWAGRLMQEANIVAERNSACEIASS